MRILPVILKPWFFVRSSILSIPSDGVDQQQQPCEVVLAQILTYKPGGHPEPGIKKIQGPCKDPAGQEQEA